MEAAAGRKPRILIVDDEDRMCRSLQILLAGEGGYDTTYALSGEEALEMVARERVDLVVADLAMPGMDGMELLRRLKQLDPKVNVVIMTAYSSVKSAIEAMKEGAFEYLIKPFGNEEFLALVERALRGRVEVAYGSADDEVFESRIVGSSPPVREVLATMRKAAATDSTVLILGESGTGKELVAREIHERGRRAKGPFVAINCAALPETLLESELFGYEKGAFTGAVRTVVGKFERADGGTVFLDEIGEMSPALQTKILRFLQEREFERVGGGGPIKVDVRIIAATNRDIKAEVERGVFRNDLYYRLSVVTIELPPLRERKEDISLLVEHFLRTKGRKLGKRAPALTDEAWNVLLNYDYPGNVRELENIIERALIVSEGDVLTPRDLQLQGLNLRGEETEQDPVVSGIWRILRFLMGVEDWPLEGGWAAKDELVRRINEEMEERLLRRAVSERPSMSNAELAKVLGTTRRVLELRLKDYGIEKCRRGRK